MAAVSQPPVVGVVSTNRQSRREGDILVRNFRSFSDMADIKIVTKASSKSAKRSCGFGKGDALDEMEGNCRAERTL